jgi:hypothetical protein
MRVDRGLSRLRPQSTMRDLVLQRSTVFMTLAAIVVGGCGERIDGVAAGGDLERYCRLVQELDTAGREAFEEAGSVTEQDAAQAGP